MRILVLGGTVFLGRAIARQALAAGHDVTCAARGTSGDPVDGARFVTADRSRPGGLSNVEGTFDAVVDVARTPSHVRHMVAELAGRVGHVTYVSSCSVYADIATPDLSEATAPLLPPAPPELDDPAAGVEEYGRCKVTCEQLILEAFPDVFVNRAGLIVGPEDPTGRFDYWVARHARGGEILTPGDPDDRVQYVDVRDLADWTLRAVQEGLTGIFNGIGAPMTRREFHAGFGGDGTLTWVPQDFLTEHDVRPWSGPRSLPLWLPLPEFAGFLTRDTSAALAAGLRTRPLRETAADTLASFSDIHHITGLTEEEEVGLLREWHAR
ncbi:NAD-dependent epimerase/dehydratase family protein [Dactylosporangium aurantiacum]|uniref:NAD-dependent epimerase/dehydratase family protein n=1 Tax=Dactylosporangium aurantiacum TaxID=35754 RepID=A0A9Q9IKS7_9ACTN|nr:NAD-dependent epimerase/dehydratase family protein [Dactylosporangium aurantiacum]MDG6104785.1 NAD-dependent epimerase/dehydratase family protein [Dactylosporangium aurantiacum]UWZ55657.1 NAD-dependent epimerase/dehydratase family protein [Dactylosporangium aurantiacum]